MSGTESPGRWSDEEFLGYVEAHSRTERGLFHRMDIARLLELCGQLERFDVAKAPEWISLHASTAAPFIEEARKRLKKAALRAKFRVIQGGKS